MGQAFRPSIGIGVALAAALARFSGSPALAAGEPVLMAAATATEELSKMSLQQLANVRVTTVARHPQSLLQTASAIQVITQAQIERSGATSIAEVLRLADNLQVAQKNAHDWAISARGFNTALANKLLVMIDGRTVYDPLFSGVFWDEQDYPLEDIDRIEVISGPGGTLWGDNAVNGVINIITKNAEDTQGLYVKAGGGPQLRALSVVRYGGEISPNTYFRVYGKVTDRDDDTLADGAPARDAWHQVRGGFRIDSTPSITDKLTLQGDSYESHEQEPTGGTAQNSGANVLGRWSRTFASGADMSVQAYVDETHLLDPQPALTFGTRLLAPAGYLHDDLTTYDLDFQHRLPVGDFAHLIWGLGYRHTHDVVGNAPSLAFLPAHLDQNLYSTFAQAEIALRANLSYTIGTKLEHNDYTGWEVQPDTRLLWTVAPGQALWGAVSRAVRAPSRVDRDLHEPAPPAPQLLEGSSDFESEDLLAYELGYRGQFTSRFSGSVSMFYNVYSNVRSTSLTPGTVLPLYFANNLEGHTYGAEFAGDFALMSRVMLHAGYTLLREHLQVKPGQVDINDAQNETADPRGQFSLQPSLNLPRNVQLDAALRWVDALHINQGPVLGTVPAYFELDSRLAWQASPRLRLTLDGENLLHERHPEYGYPGPDRVEIDRSIYLTASWSP